MTVSYGMQIDQVQLMNLHQHQPETIKCLFKVKGTSWKSVELFNHVISKRNYLYPIFVVSS